MTINAYKKNAEIFARVQNLTSSSSQWIEGGETDKVWLCEYVIKLKGVVQKSKEKINELSIHTISYLQLHVRRHGTPKVPIRGFGQIYDITLQALPGKHSPSFKDHRKAKTPYLSRYGERWVDKLKSSTAMSKFCCITDLIHFMMNEVEKLMKGSVHEDDFYIIHDYLVLMTSKETIKWMKQNSYLPRWLIPLNGLQDGTPYAGRPVGNSPGFMPLDNSLNRDILHYLRMYSILSRYILVWEETDEEERDVCFSYSTPREIAQ